MSSIKPAEIEPNAFIIRLFESFGGAASIKLFVKHARIVSVDLCDALEQSISNIPIEMELHEESHSSEYISLEFRAFEIKTLLVRLYAV